jgi:hypothetical protein
MPEFSDYESMHAKYGRRDLARFSHQRWSREKLDEALRRALKDVPYEDGHWRLR